jgi:hypothetical protein
MEAKKVINAHLWQFPYSPSTTSKALVTTPENQASSSWCKKYYFSTLNLPCPTHLFVDESSRFDSKGFEMIMHIDKYFNPSDVVDSLGYICELINIGAPEGTVGWRVAHRTLGQGFKPLRCQSVPPWLGVGAPHV